MFNGSRLKVNVNYRSVYCAVDNTTFLIRDVSWQLVLIYLNCGADFADVLTPDLYGVVRWDDHRCGQEAQRGL